MGTNPFTKSEVDPSFSKEENAVNQMLQKAMVQSSWTADKQRPLLPPRFGYDRTEPGWDTIMTLDRNFRNDRRQDYSGVRAGYEGTARPAIGYV